MSQIPDADWASIQNIRQASDWQNPYLFVAADTITLQDRPGYSGRTIYRDHIGELADILLSLPTEAWPYGRIVAIQEPGPMGVNDGPRVKENREQVEAILSRLHIAKYGWASA